MTKILGEQFKDFKKGDLIKRLQKKYGKNKVNENTSMKKIMELMGQKEGGVTEGIKKIKAKGLKNGAMTEGVKAALIGAGAATILKNKNKSKVKLSGDRPEGSPPPTVFPKKKKTTNKKEVIGPGVLTEKEQRKALEGLIGKFKVVPPAYGKQRRKIGKEKPRKGLSEGGMNLSPKADLDGDGMFSKYERARGEAIQKAMAENKKVEGGIVRGGGQAIKGIKFKGVM